MIVETVDSFERARVNVLVLITHRRIHVKEFEITAVTWFPGFYDLVLRLEIRQGHLHWLGIKCNLAAEFTNLIR